MPNYDYDVKLSVPEAAYLAGLVDGEGTIAVYVREAIKTAREKKPSLVIALRICMCNETVVKHIKNITGVGSIHKCKPRGAKYKTPWLWAATSRQAEAVLANILPYMIVKKEQAELLLEVVDLKRQSTRNGQVNIERQFAIAGRVKYLNRKGE